MVLMLDHAGMRQSRRIHWEVRHDAHVMELIDFPILLNMKNLIANFLFACLRHS